MAIRGGTWWLEKGQCHTQHQEGQEGPGELQTNQPQFLGRLWSKSFWNPSLSTKRDNKAVIENSQAKSYPFISFNTPYTHLCPLPRMNCTWSAWLTSVMRWLAQVDEGMLSALTLGKSWTCSPIVSLEPNWWDTDCLSGWWGGWDMDWTLGLRCGPQSHRVELETSYLCTPFRGWYWGQQKAYQDCQGMEHGTSEEKLGKLHLFSFSGETALGVSCCSLQLNWAGCVGKMEPGFLQGYTIGEGWEATKLKDGSLKSELWKKIRCYEGVQTLAQVPQRGGIVILGDTQNLCEEWPEQPVLAQITLSRTLV